MQPVDLSRPGLGVVLPGTGESGLIVNVVLPGNYKKNTPAILRLQILSFSTPPCGIMLEAGNITRYRTGQLWEFESGAGAGFAAVTSGATLSPTPAAKLFKKEFKISKPSIFTLQNQKPGDSVTLQILRDGDHANDTCNSNIAVTGARLIYKTP